MPVGKPTVFPTGLFLEFRDTKYTALRSNPNNGEEVYLADAIDYQQQGIVNRY